MGMYTGLRFRGIVKKEYADMISSIAAHDSDWEDWVETFPFLEEFAGLPRSGMIPRGGFAYMPDEWEDPNNIITASFLNTMDSETRYWSFACSLKNYDYEINLFLSKVLSVILESSQYIEVLYEEWAHGELYQLIDGRIMQVGITEVNYHDREKEEQELSDWWEWQQGEDG